MRKLFYVLMACMVLTYSCDGPFAGTDEGFNNGGDVGQGGSTARFTIFGDHLYVVNSNSLESFDISDEKDPKWESSTHLGIGIETIFGYRNNLFIGGQSGMYIYTVNEDGSPQYRSEYIHQTACDPVIANEDYAYVTIRSGEACNNLLFEANRLITLDVTDLDNPKPVDEQQMINPRGLCFFKGDLYVAEGSHGLKKFSLEIPSQPALLEHYEDIAANDMIALGNTMIITRDEGIFQFGCENNELFLLSPIK